MEADCTVFLDQSDITCERNVALSPRPSRSHSASFLQLCMDLYLTDRITQGLGKGSFYCKTQLFIKLSLVTMGQAGGHRFRKKENVYPHLKCNYSDSQLSPRLATDNS